MTAQRKKAEETFIKIVQTIRCPDYGEHRETEAYAEFRKKNIEFLEKALLEERENFKKEFLPYITHSQMCSYIWKNHLTLTDEMKKECDCGLIILLSGEKAK